jgi:hypothetical protein
LKEMTAKIEYANPPFLFWPSQRTSQ